MEAVKDSDLSKELLELKKKGVVLKSIGDRAGINRTDISLVTNNGKRLSDEKEARIWAVINEIKAQDEALATQPLSPKMYKTDIGLFETEEYREGIGWCSYIYQYRKMGVLIGHPGSGKTTILNSFRKLHPRTIFVEAWQQMRVKDLLDALASGLNVPTSGHSYRRTQQLIAALSRMTDVCIVIDEAEYLAKWDVDKIELLRKIWDNTGTPTILCGTSILENIITRGRGRRDNLAQLYRRQQQLKLNGISQGETRLILRDYNVTQDAVNTLAAIAADVKHGGFGTFVEILGLCLRTADGGQINAETLRNALKYKLMA